MNQRTAEIFDDACWGTPTIGGLSKGIGIDTKVWPWGRTVQITIRNTRFVMRGKTGVDEAIPEAELATITELWIKLCKERAKGGNVSTKKDEDGQTVISFKPNRRKK